jgi:hypothetical protein
VNVDVSRARGAQNEPVVAVDPRDPGVLLAGSNSFSERSMRVYGSIDGGRSWTSAAGPPPVRGLPDAAADDPGVAIDDRGRQYFSFVQIASRSALNPRSWLVVASRAGVRSSWRSTVVPGAANVDKPALAVGGGHVYVVWIAHLPDGSRVVRLSSSRDGGRAWSTPTTVSQTAGLDYYPSVAVAAGDTVYVAWMQLADLLVARSTDAGVSFGRAGTIATVPPASVCGFPIPAQPLCVWQNPVLTVDRGRGRVYVSWSGPGANGALDVFADRLGDHPRQVNPPDGRFPSDQFWPAAAVDQSTGRLWICFYDTRGDPTRIHAVYTCTTSPDAGNSWTRPRPVASASSNEAQPHAAHGRYGREYGDYEGLAAADGVAHPIWTDSRNLATLNEEIYTTRLTTPNR